MIIKNTILASKLYNNSQHKDKIISALENPINSELLQQSIDEVNLPEPEVPSDSSKENAGKENNKESEKTGKSNKGGKSGGMNIKHITSEPKKMSFTPSDDDTSDSDTPDELPVADDSIKIDDGTESAESATKLNGKAIKASSNIEYVELNSGVIKDTLNSMADTAGVVSVMVKEADSDELWLYYDDEANLNDKIYAVVSLFNSSGYNMLRFNRLARSNNAMVFDILRVAEDIKPITEIADET